MGNQACSVGWAVRGCPAGERMERRAKPKHGASGTQSGEVGLVQKGVGTNKGF